MLSRKEIVICSLTTAVALTIGITIGYMVIRKKESSDGAEDRIRKVFASFQRDVDNYRMREQLRNLTSRPNLAGTQREHDVARYVAHLWSESGLDSVHLLPYRVALSYPIKEKPNTIRLQNDNIVIEPKEPASTPQESVDGVAPPFIGFSPSGTVQGSLLFVNYGREEDYDSLKTQGLNPSGKIVLCRYGKGFRGDKVKTAEIAGAAGIILYNDPLDSGNYTSGPKDKYPHYSGFSTTGTQRGNAVLRKGDQSTPDWPSLEYSAREKLSPDVLPSLPKIPVLPIGFNDAVKIMSYSKPPAIPEFWKERIQQEDPQNLRKSSNLTLDVHMELKYVWTHNVIGIIKGKLEPDRYVVMGNHHDAWTFGAVDPMSGTAAQLEIVRVMGKAYKKGWQPRRTIVFASWGAEEYGLVGSTEWVEEFVRLLKGRTVGYVNIDICSSGDFVPLMKAHPVLRNTLFEIAKKVEACNGNGISCYDALLTKGTLDDDGLPIVKVLGGGSDFLPFVQTLGVPSADLSYRLNSKVFPSTYPMYHTLYDTFEYFDNFVDPELKCCQSTARITIGLVLELAEKPILPFNISRLAEVLQVYTDRLEANYKALLDGLGITLNYLKKMVLGFSKAAEKFQKTLNSVAVSDFAEVRQVNDQLILMEQAFVLRDGIFGRPWLRHILYTPSVSDAYSAASFPSITDILRSYTKVETTVESASRAVNHSLTLVTDSIREATTILVPVRSFDFRRIPLE